MNTEDALAPILNALPQDVPTTHRFVIAIAGPPTAGKSTIAQALSLALAPRAAVLGLDAFHFDDGILEARGDRPRKGAPHTFDVDGYRRALAALRSEPGATISVPRFDRDLELSRNAAEVVTADHPILITEGNYLLLDRDPWHTVRPLFDLTVFLKVDMSTVESRTMQRWDEHGFSADEAGSRFVSNDEPNARLILEHSLSADIEIVND